MKVSRKTKLEIADRAMHERLMDDENNRLRAMLQKSVEAPVTIQSKPVEFVTGLIRNAFRPKKLTVKYPPTQGGYGRFNVYLRRREERARAN